MASIYNFSEAGGTGFVPASVPSVDRSSFDSLYQISRERVVGNMLGIQNMQDTIAGIMEDAEKMAIKANVSGTIIPSIRVIDFMMADIDDFLKSFVKHITLPICEIKSEDEYNYVIYAYIEKEKEDARGIRLNTEMKFYRIMKDTPDIYEKFEHRGDGSYGWGKADFAEVFGAEKEVMDMLGNDKTLNIIYQDLCASISSTVSTKYWKEFYDRNRKLINVLNDPIAERTVRPIIVATKDAKRQIYLVPKRVGGFAISYEEGDYHIRLYGPEMYTDYINRVIGTFPSTGSLIRFFEDYLYKAFLDGDAFVFPLSEKNILVYEGVDGISEIDFDNIEGDFDEEEKKIIETLSNYVYTMNLTT